jgi:hypothetical protein
MSKHLWIWAIAVAALCLVLSCSKSTRNEAGKVDITSSPVEGTPKENEEAELIALCLSGQLVAPDDLYAQVLTDLASIRSAFGESLDSVVQITFWPHWVPGCLVIGFDDTTVAKIRAGEYHDWDDLNEQYGLESLDTSMISWLGFVRLDFIGRLHPYRLREVYAALPGVRAASPNGIRGDGPNVYARETTSGMTYLFRKGWNDCPSGCIDNAYWYFVFQAGQPQLVGCWPEYDGSPQPSWWEEARLNKENYCP